MTEIQERLTAVLAGRYTIERELGRGGMAVVFLARDERYHRLVALKVMLPEVIARDGGERFRREIAIAARLNHPHILTVFDSGEADDFVYYAMPYVEGDPLNHVIAVSQQLGIMEAVSITRQVADALDYAHSQGVVHRDIKPGNILLMQSRTGSGRTPLVSDFGIARATTAEGSTRLTATGLMVGTPTYMSPEQWAGSSSVDGRTDQYSLACVLYEMLIGEPPFTGGTPMIVLARHTREAVPSLRAVRPTIPDALEQVIFRALSKMPADRFSSMAEFSDALAVSVEGGIVYNATGDVPIPRIPSPASIEAMIQSAARLRDISVPITAGHVIPQPPPSIGATGYVDSRAPTEAFTVTPVPTPVPGPPPGKRRTWMIAGAALLLATATGLGMWKLTRPATTSRMRVMVLPFKQSGAVRDSTFADGLAEEITSRLAGVRDLGVIAQTSALQYKDVNKTAREIGQEVKAGRLIRGTIRWLPEADARKAIVSVSIVDTDNEELTNVGEFDAAKLNDLYGIANEIAARLDINIDAAGRSRLTEKPTNNPEAYAAYQEGHRLFNKSWDSADVKASIVAFERAVSLDRRFALALAALGRAHGWIYQLSIDQTPARLDYARAAVDSAMHISPNLPEAHLAKGLLAYWGNRDYEQAIDEFKTVQRLLPSSAEAFHNMANVQRRKGAFQDAIANYDLAADLDPRSFNPIFSRAEMLLYLRDYTEAERLANLVISIAPDFIDGYILKATIQIHKHGDVGSAARMLNDLEKRFPPDQWRPLRHHWRAGLFRIVDSTVALAEHRMVPGSFGTDTVHYLIARGNMNRLAGQTVRARIYFDSAAAMLEGGMARGRPGTAVTYGQLGIAYAGMGLTKRDEAVRAAQRAAEMINEKNDALDGPEWVINVATVYTMLGDTENALNWLDRAMRIPSRLSPKWIERDPIWTPLRNNPNFKKLISNPPPIRTTPVAAK